MSTRRFFPLAAVGAILLLIALLAYGIASRNPDRTIDNALAKGERKPAPDRELPLLNGSGRRSLADFKRKYVVVNFWASWCDPCRKESPALQRFYEEQRERGVVVLGVDSLDVDSDAHRFIRRYKLTYPQVRDKEGERRQAWGITGFPETFIVDRVGKIAWVSRGPVTEPMLLRAIKQVRREDRR